MSRAPASSSGTTTSATRPADVSDEAARGPWGAVRALAADIKLAHTVFAMPFALLAAVMAHAASGAGWARFAGQALLVVACMVTARTAAMLANRWFDREIDARNPRTVGRALPSGRVRPRDVLVGLGLASATFVACCGGFGLAYGNWWPLALAVPVLAWLVTYPLAKRRTWLCHVHLGSALALSPLAAALAVHPPAVLERPALWLVAGQVLVWVAGFDILYALQDVEVDRRDGLHSMPSRLGPGRAILVARGLPASAVALLAAAVLVDPALGLAFGIATAAAAGLLVVEHVVTAGGTTARIALAFFTLNGIVSCLLGAAGILDVLLHRSA